MKGPEIQALCLWLGPQSNSHTCTHVSSLGTTCIPLQIRQVVKKKFNQSPTHFFPGGRTEHIAWDNKQRLHWDK